MLVPHVAARVHLAVAGRAELVPQLDHAGVLRVGLVLRLGVGGRVGAAPAEPLRHEGVLEHHVAEEAWDRVVSGDGLVALTSLARVDVRRLEHVGVELVAESCFEAELVPRGVAVDAVAVVALGGRGEQELGRGVAPHLAVGGADPSPVADGDLAVVPHHRVVVQGADAVGAVGDHLPDARGVGLVRQLARVAASV